jgi:hypothetical protein
MPASDSEAHGASAGSSPSMASSLPAKGSGTRCRRPRRRASTCGTNRIGAHLPVYGRTVVVALVGHDRSDPDRGRCVRRQSEHWQVPEDRSRPIRSPDRRSECQTARRLVAARPLAAARAASRDRMNGAPSPRRFFRIGATYLALCAPPGSANRCSPARCWTACRIGGLLCHCRAAPEPGTLPPGPWIRCRMR